MLDFGGSHRQTQNSETGAVSVASCRGKGRRLSRGEADLPRKSDCCCIKRATMLFQGTTPRVPATADSLCLIVFAFLLQPSLPAGASDSRDSRASQETAAEDVAARGDEESI